MTKMGMKRTKARKAIKRKLPKVAYIDNVFSQYVRLMADGYCKRCGKRVGYADLDNAHFHGRKRFTVRWNPKNTAPLCSICHSKVDTNPLAKVEFFMSILSKEDFDELNRIADMTIKEYPIDKEAIYQDYKNKVRLLKDE